MLLLPRHQPLPKARTRRGRSKAIRFGPAAVALVAAITLVTGACDEAEEKAKEVGARASAEGLRASLKAQDTDDVTGGVRSVKALNEAADDLPDQAEVVGIADGDGDGVDDDGLVEVKVDQEFACVTVPESGDDIDVSGGRCS
jgi:hypothetical protein